MKTRYYYVPPCPVCKSEVTGRYVPTPFGNKHYMIMESLRNGEIVRYAKKVPEKNVFCENCGFEWHEDIDMIFIEQEEKEGEIARRGTERKLKKYMEDHNINPDKKQFLGGMFSGLIHFF